MIVVDTNVVAHMIVDSPSSSAARALYRDDPEWHAPELWFSEFRNLLAGEMRRRGTQLEVARQFAAAAANLLRQLHRVESNAVLQLVAQSTCTAYDLEFVALAMTLGVSLVTMDKQILREFPQVARGL